MNIVIFGINSFKINIFFFQFTCYKIRKQLYWLFNKRFVLYKMCLLPSLHWLHKVRCACTYLLNSFKNKIDYLLPVCFFLLFLLIKSKKWDFQFSGKLRHSFHRLLWAYLAPLSGPVQPTVSKARFWVTRN